MRDATHAQPITAEDMLAKMRAGIKEVSSIRIRELVLPVRVLSVDEMNAIRHEALKKSAMGDQVDHDLAMQKSTLLLASTIGGKGSVPGMSEKFLGLCSTDEINHLYNEYVVFLDGVNPSLEIISEADFRALVDAVKKNAVTTRDLSLHQLKAIFTAFQGLIQKPEMQKSHPVN
jgi:hypothetical protein